MTAAALAAFLCVVAPGAIVLWFLGHFSKNSGSHHRETDAQECPLEMAFRFLNEDDGIQKLKARWARLDNCCGCGRCTDCQAEEAT